MSWTVTVGLPGVQGDVVTGTHGIGVSTPCAAAVADATSGLLGDMHMPKVAMLVIGWKSITVAAGAPPAVTPVVGRTVSDAVPGGPAIVHDSNAPLHTCCVTGPSRPRGLRERVAVEVHARGAVG